jgi:hypothetical protein
MIDLATALLAISSAVEERNAYLKRFLATTPLTDEPATGGGPQIDIAEVKRLDDLVCQRGNEYEQAWEDAGRPVRHYMWKSPDLQCE